MLLLSGVLLLVAAYLVLMFTHFACLHRPDSFWASETMVLVALGPTVMILFVGGGACLAKAWVDGGLQQLDGVDAALGAAGIVLIVLVGYLSGLRLRRSRPTAA